MRKLNYGILISWLVLFSYAVKAQSLVIPEAPKVKASSYIIMDANSGAIIAEHNSKDKYAPASLTKMLALYIFSQHLTKGEINLDDKVRISTKAWQTGGSKTFLKEGQYVTVEDLLKGIIVQSGNDATVAMAEHLAGSINAFVGMMNQLASSLGMHDTHFVDPVGLPKDHQLTTAYDMALLSKALINDFPQLYHWYQQKWFTFNGIKQPNRNRLLWRVNEVDGIKTGVTDAGYVQAISGSKNGMRTIIVTFGSSTDAERAEAGTLLFTYANRFYESHRLYEARKPISKTRIWFGSQTNIEVGVLSSVYATLPSGQYENLQANLSISQNLQAPIHKEQVIGKLEIRLGDKLLQEYPVISLNSVSKGTVLNRLLDNFAYYWQYLKQQILN